MENEILGLIAEGLTDRGIAERLNYSVRTIESHIHKIVSKLDIGIDQNWRVLMALAWLRGGI
jgi:DNA-binding NarL/FixJ family response regulator